jgi:hypothetical protein
MQSVCWTLYTEQCQIIRWVHAKQNTLNIHWGHIEQTESPHCIQTEQWTYIVYKLNSEPLLYTNWTVNPHCIQTEQSTHIVYKLNSQPTLYTNWINSEPTSYTNWTNSKHTFSGCQATFSLKNIGIYTTFPRKYVTVAEHRHYRSRDASAILTVSLRDVHRCRWRLTALITERNCIYGSSLYSESMVIFLTKITLLSCHTAYTYCQKWKKRRWNDSGRYREMICQRMCMCVQRILLPGNQQHETQHPVWI